MEEILRWLIQHAKDNEWRTAPGYTNCRYCAPDGADQNRHNPGCVYVRMMGEAEQLLRERDKALLLSKAASAVEPVEPYLGQTVWYHHGGRVECAAGIQPFVATVAYYHDYRRDEHSTYMDAKGDLYPHLFTVNIGYLDHNGVAHSKTHVPLLAKGQDLPADPFCLDYKYQHRGETGA